MTNVYNPPAFPCIWEKNYEPREKDKGMTLRDYFAGKTLTIILESEIYFQPKGQQTLAEAKAELAYIFADAMLKARQS